MTRIQRSGSEWIKVHLKKSLRGPSMQTEAVERDSSVENVPSNPEHCPACGYIGGGQWLQAPDRFQGRPPLYQLLRCRECSLVWLKNPPSPEEMGYHYGPDYDRAIAGAGEDPKH